jgi:hypothetical protein
MDSVIAASPLRINHSFSMQLPQLQTIIDQTSLGEFKLCPRRYYYRIVEGWVPRQPSVHLQFGLLLHQGRETYERVRSQGADHQTALRETVRDILSCTWDKRTGKAWHSGHSEKNRFTLIQTLVWYLDAYGANDPAKTVMLRNGKPAIELTFKFVPRDFYTGDEFIAITGEPIYFAGHLDRLAILQGSTFICDLKTTGSSYLGDKFFSQFNPDNQVSFYTYAGKWSLTEPEALDETSNTPEIAGLIIDAAQIRVNFTRFERQIIPRTTPQIVEWLTDTKHWLQLMGIYAERNYWPMNDKSCSMYGGCPYRPVCSRTPGARQNWLEADYVRSTWDPSQARSI